MYLSNRYNYLQATAFHYPPRTFVTKDDSGNDVVTGGYEYIIFDTIAKKLKYVCCGNKRMTFHCKGFCQERVT